MLIMACKATRKMKIVRTTKWQVHSFHLKLRCRNNKHLYIFLSTSDFTFDCLFQPYQTFLWPLCLGKTANRKVKKKVA